MKKIRIRAGAISALAVLDDSETASAVWEALPLKARANRWGDEIYFGIPVQVGAAEDARDVVESGELGYWPPGSAFCIFWGLTPASQRDEIRAASPVNVFGRLTGDPLVFHPVTSGAEITLEREG